MSPVGVFSVLPLEPRPIFIIGSGRSGTSVLTWAIGQHPNIITLPETSWIAALVSQLSALYRMGASDGEYTQLSAFGVTKNTFFQAFGQTIDVLVRSSFDGQFRSARSEPGEEVFEWLRHPDDPKQRWVDGTPGNTPYAGLLADVFPRARFIHLIREPIEVMRSLLAFKRRSQLWGGDLDAVLDFAYHTTRSGHLAEASIGPERVIRVFHREFSSPQPLVRKLLDFLGEPFSTHCIAPLHERINATAEALSGAEAELDGLLERPMMSELRAWYTASQNASWQIAAADAARPLLADYEAPTLPGA